MLYCFLYSLLPFSLKSFVTAHSWRDACPIRHLSLYFRDEYELLDFKHCSDQSFSNKCDCTRHVNIINTDVTIILLGSLIMTPQTFQCLFVSLIRHSESYLTVGLFLTHLGRRTSSVPRSLSLLLGLKPHFVNRKWANLPTRPNTS